MTAAAPLPLSERARMQTLDIANVSLIYPGQLKGREIVALKGVDLTIHSGDFVVALAVAMRRP